MAIRYRQDIDGLRAVAVISVLLHHAGFDFARGGFVGVDIFFVISGYLITLLILKEVQQGEFSFGTFYERRIRRLLPPIVPVLVLTWIGGFLVLSEQQFIDYSRSFYATLAFGANWHFLSTIGYFDAESEAKPLLHMWSLSIEEQFYLAFPALLVLLLRRAPRLLRPVTLILFAASLAYATLLISKGQAEVAFFNSLARFWELLVGALLASTRSLRPSSRLAITSYEAAGAALILASALTYSEGTPFPGISAILPTVGTALIIAAGGRGGLISAVLSSNVFVGVGLISYALYLWHWPILVFIRLAVPEAGTVTTSAGLALTVALSITSYFIIERPFRSKAVLSTRRSAFGLLAATVTTLALLISVGGSSLLSQTRSTLLAQMRYALFEGDRGAALAAIDAEETYYHRVLNQNFTGASGDFRKEEHRNWTCSFDLSNTGDRVLDCLVQQATDRNVLVIGDSIGRDTTHALRLAFPSLHFIMLHHSGCVPASYPIRGPDKNCFPALRDVLERVRTAINVNSVVLAFRFRPKDWMNVRDGIPLVSQLTDNVVMLGVSPVFKRSISDFVKRLPGKQAVPLSISKRDAEMVGWDYSSLVKSAQLLARKHNMKFVNVHHFFCDERRCALWVDDAYDKPLYWDQQHLTQFGIAKYAAFLAEQKTLRTALLGELATLAPH